MRNLERSTHELTTPKESYGLTTCLPARKTRLRQAGLPTVRAGLSNGQAGSQFTMRIYTLILLFFFSQGVLAQDAGFFLEDFQTKQAEIPSSFTDIEKPSEPATVTVSVDFADVVAPVSKYLFGNNANPFMTQMVDQPVLLDHIKTLSPNVIRFPGGNLSSVFFWNASVGQPPADAPAGLVDASGAQINSDYWFGKNAASWTLSVDNYYAMLEATSSTGIITINYGYARYSTAADPVASAAHLAAEWVRADNGRTKFWEIGNESNGTWQAGHRIKLADNKDGQPEIITGELYGKHFKVFADSMRKAASEIEVPIYIGAQLLAEEPAGWWNNTDRHWNSGVFEHADNTPDYYIIHSYYTPYQTNSTPLDILNSASTVTRDMMEYVTSSIADAGVSPKPVALTEWNIFAEGSKQQVSYINGMHSAIVLGELIQNKYGLACRWDLANGWSNGNDHGMFSQGDEPGVPKWNPRAAYYYLYYFQKYFGDHVLRSLVSGSPDVMAYASRFSSGEAALVVINKSTSSHTVLADLENYGYGERFYSHTLTGGTDNGVFSLKVFVNGKGPSVSSGGPPNLTSVKAESGTIGGGVKFHSPPRSVQYILIESGDHIITRTEEEEEITVEVYPNPGKSGIKLNLSNPGFFKAEITDLMGARVGERKIGLHETSIDLTIDLRPGVYSLLLFKGKNIFQKKIIIY